MTTKIEPFSLPPEEAIKWFQSKGYAITWDWRDMWNADHARAFTVAKVSQLDVLADIRTAVDDALRNGTSFAEFQKQLRPELQKKGWWGEKELADPETGEVKKVQLGSARRLRIIYDTNLRTAHAAGKWERIQDRKKALPYLRYIPRTDGDNRRKEHQALRDTVLPVDDPFWDTFYPPNGWGCACSVQQVNDRMLKSLGLSVNSKAPKIPAQSYTNRRTGEVTKVPKGISPGFAYNVGKGRAGLAPSKLPVLTPTRGYSDYERSNMAEVSGRDAPQKLPPMVRSKQGARQQFRSAFGTSDAEPARAVRDPKGLDVVFDERSYKVTRGNAPYLNHAKAAVEDPDEIWLVPYRLKDDSVVLRQRYITKYAEPNGESTYISVNHDGTFKTLTASGLDKQRVGYLHHARGAG